MTSELKKMVDQWTKVPFSIHASQHWVKSCQLENNTQPSTLSFIRVYPLGVVKTFTHVCFFMSFCNIFFFSFFFLSILGHSMSLSTHTSVAISLSAVYDFFGGKLFLCNRPLQGIYLNYGWLESAVNCSRIPQRQTEWMFWQSATTW